MTSILCILPLIQAQSVKWRLLEGVTSSAKCMRPINLRFSSQFSGASQQASSRCRSATRRILVYIHVLISCYLSEKRERVSRCNRADAKMCTALYFAESKFNIIIIHIGWRNVCGIWKRGEIRIFSRNKQNFQYSLLISRHRAQ